MTDAAPHLKPKLPRGLLLGIVVAALALFLLWQKRQAYAGLVRN